MDRDEIFKFISETGRRTLHEIRAQFSSSNQEILDSILIYLTERHQVRKVSFQASYGKEDLYYILPK